MARSYNAELNSNDAIRENEVKNIAALRNQNALPGLTPNFFSMIAIGQKPVNADCNKLAPTKAVNHSHNSE